VGSPVTYEKVSTEERLDQRVFVLHAGTRWCDSLVVLLTFGGRTSSDMQSAGEHLKGKHVRVNETPNGVILLETKQVQFMQ